MTLIGSIAAAQQGERWGLSLSEERQAALEPNSKLAEGVGFAHPMSLRSKKSARPKACDC